MNKLLQTIALCFVFCFGINAQNFVKLNKNNFQEKITILKDQALEIRLPAKPSTGFGWYLKKGQSTLVKETGNREFITDNPDKPIGAAGTQVIHFIATAKGTSELELLYKRPWEGEDMASDRFVITVICKGKYTGKKIAALVDDIGAPKQASHKTTTLPTSFSWLAQGLCTVVKDQSSCGSCWAFAGCASFESVIKIVDNNTRDLSEQWIVNCDQLYSGCDGGDWPHHLFKDSGSVYEADLPYTAQTGTCGTSYTYHEKINGFTHISTWPTDAEIKQAIYDYGPVWAGVNAGSHFSNYSGGILTQTDGTTPQNHAIVLVGWDDANSCWILRNSWGTGWGENGGYMRIGYGVCGVGGDATYIDYKGPISHTAPPVVDFSISSALSCTGTVNFTDNSSNTPTAWSWNFGDGQTSTQQNPTHTYTSAGTYNVQLTAQNTYGNNSVTKNNLITVSLLSAPVTTGDARTGVGVVNLSATANAPLGTLNWYDQPVAGNLVNTGAAYSPSLNYTTTFYVANETSGPLQHTGLLNNSAGGSYYTANTDRRLYFDVLNNMTLKSVVIYANTAGNRDIEVLNDAGITVATTTYAATAGMNTVPLNFNIAAGTHYAIKLGAGSAKIDLFRNNTGVNYPYTISNLVSITSSDAGTTPANYYYYFYNWQVQTQGCESPRTPVTGTVNGVNGIVDVTQNNVLSLFPNPNDGSFTIEGLERDNLIEIYDALGQIVFQTMASNSTASVNIKNYDKGVYFCKITNTYSKAVKVGKVVKQ